MTGKRRIAILGGGVGALSAAFALSELDPTGKHYEITLYQLGWRLGGKTANGRNAAYGQRIEEHGLHIWAGFYENAFTILRAALKALGRPAGSPQATIEQAFERQNQVFMTERHGDAWLPWPVWFEPDADPDLYPGRDSIFAAADDIMPPTEVLLRRAFASVEYNYIYYKEHWTGDPEAEGRRAIDMLPESLRRQIDAMLGGLAAPNLLMLVAKLLLERLAANPLSEEIRFATLIVLDILLKAVQHELRVPTIERGFRRYLLMLDLTLRVTIGIIKNDGLRHGLHVLDQFEFQEFLAHAGPIEPTEQSVLVESLYDYAFGYAAGTKPSMSACGSVQGLLRMFLTYKGGFFYKATAGMGDTICTPIYLLLKQRGVKFAFFSEVTSLTPDAAGFAVETIGVTQQVALAAGRAEYDPLVTVKGLECWPSEPHWDQLEDGAALAAAGVDFEDVLGHRWTGVPRTLRRGVDFDEVVLGISLGSLADLCAPLIAVKPVWRDMIANLATTRTQAFQLWMTDERVDMGGPYTAPVIPPPLPKMPPRGPEKLGPIVTGYQKPFDTYADMSHLIPVEDWPTPGGPKSVAYFCSVLADSAPGEQGAADALVKANAIEWIETQLQTLWPNVFSNGQMDWSKIWCKDLLVGQARFDEQFWQANINPSERYVLARPGTLQYRIAPGASGFENLFLAGDWTKVPDINAGCVEVAAMSGLMAASALTGYDIPIVHGDTLYANPPFVNYGGWMSLPPAPAIGKQTSFHSWVFEADRDALQDFVDRSLNTAAGRKRFKVLAPLVFLNKVKTGDLTSADPAYGNEGRMAETDVGFWMLLGRYDFGPEIMTGYGWFPAYLFVDEPYATACGREIWGFPKYTGNIISASDEAHGPFTVSAEVIDHFKPGTPATMQTLITATPDVIEPRGFFGTILEGIKDVAEHLAEGVAFHLTALAERHHLLGANGILPHVYFLKQFRAADDATEACYRQILKGALTLDHQYSFHFLHGDWTFTLRDTDSMPFVRDLGLGTPVDGVVTLKSGMGFHAVVDFTVAPASPIG